MLGQVLRKKLANGKSNSFFVNAKVAKRTEAVKAMSMSTAAGNARVAPTFQNFQQEQNMVIRGPQINGILRGARVVDGPVTSFQDEVAKVKEAQNEANINNNEKCSSFFANVKAAKQCKGKQKTEQNMNLNTASAILKEEEITSTQQQQENLLHKVTQQSKEQSPKACPDIPQRVLDYRFQQQLHKNPLTEYKERCGMLRKQCDPVSGKRLPDIPWAFQLSLKNESQVFPSVRSVGWQQVTSKGMDYLVLDKDRHNDTDSQNNKTINKNNKVPIAISTTEGVYPPQEGTPCEQWRAEGFAYKLPRKETLEVIMTAPASSLAQLLVCGKMEACERASYQSPHYINSADETEDQKQSLKLKEKFITKRSGYSSTMSTKHSSKSKLQGQQTDSSKTTNENHYNNDEDSDKLDAYFQNVNSIAQKIEAYRASNKSKHADYLENLVAKYLALYRFRPLRMELLQSATKSLKKRDSEQSAVSFWDRYEWVSKKIEEVATENRSAQEQESQIQVELDKVLNEDIEWMTEATNCAPRRLRAY